MLQSSKYCYLFPHAGTNSDGEQELVVNLELNGIKYSGLLISNTSKLATSIATASNETTTSTATMSSISNNKNVNNSNKSDNNIATISRKNGTHSHTPTNIINNTNESSKDLVVAMDAVEDTSAVTMRDTETPPNTSMTATPPAIATNQTNAVIANGPNSSTNPLKDALITS